MANLADTAEVGAYAVAYLDVLGTAQRLEKLEGLTLESEIKPGTKDHELLMETVLPVVAYRELLNRYFEGFRQSQGLDSLQPEQREKMRAIAESCIQNYGFSDSLYAVARFASQDDWFTPSVGMFTILFGSCLAMAISLSQKCPLRGGIDVGKGVTLPGNENFSNALVRALKLERHIAGHPRIVIGDSMYRLLETIANLGYTEGDGKRAVDTARRAKRFITEDDSDGRYILDYLGQGFRDHVGPGYFADVIQPAHNFVLAEHARLLKERDVKLAPRYGEVKRYFEKRLPLWRE
jgi:hypothetical protein